MFSFWWIGGQSSNVLYTAILLYSFHHQTMAAMLHDVRTSYAPANHAASHDDHEKPKAWFCKISMGMVAPLERAFGARGSSAIKI